MHCVLQLYWNVFWLIGASIGIKFLKITAQLANTSPACLNGPKRTPGTLPQVLTNIHNKAKANKRHINQSWNASQRPDSHAVKNRCFISLCIWGRKDIIWGYNKNTIKGCCLINLGILFEDLAHAYLTDLKPYCIYKCFPESKNKIFRILPCIILMNRKSFKTIVKKQKSMLTDS